MNTKKVTRSLFTVWQDVERSYHNALIFLLPSPRGALVRSLSLCLVHAATNGHSRVLSISALPQETSLCVVSTHNCPSFCPLTLLNFFSLSFRLSFSFIASTCSLVSATAETAALSKSHLLSIVSLSLSLSPATHTSSSNTSTINKHIHAHQQRVRVDAFNVLLSQLVPEYTAQQIVPPSASLSVSVCMSVISLSLTRWSTLCIHFVFHHNHCDHKFLFLPLNVTLSAPSVLSLLTNESISASMISSWNYLPSPPP